LIIGGDPDAAALEGRSDRAAIPAQPAAPSAAQTLIDRSLIASA
jgi:hypothetical protein